MAQLVEWLILTREIRGSNLQSSKKNHFLNEPTRPLFSFLKKNLVFLQQKDVKNNASCKIRCEEIQTHEFRHYQRALL